MDDDAPALSPVARDRPPDTRATAVVARDLAAARSIFARTMPDNPHEYTLRREWASDADFVRAVLFMREHGYQSLFHGRWYTQLDLGEYTYWTMGEPVGETILINRKRLAAPRADTPARPDGPDAPDGPA